MTDHKPKTLDEAARNADGTYDGAKALAWLCEALHPGAGISEEDVKTMWARLKAWREAEKR